MAENRSIFYLKFALSLAAVAILMAVSCPKPVPPGPDDGGKEEEIKGPEQRLFEDISTPSLSIGGALLLGYDGQIHQKGVNLQRRSVRFQADDQTSYLSLTFNDRIPRALGDEAVCTMVYSLTADESTTLIVKFTVVRAGGGMLWLWNEVQKIGVLCDDINL